jgi:hypothetical protein
MARTSFGIACFNFGLNRLEVIQMTGQEYVQKLTSCLNSFPSIRNVEIEWDVGFDSSVDFLCGPIEEGSSFSPPVLAANVRLDIYIPFRMQAELLGTDIDYLETYTEMFRVRKVCGYFYSVTFIEPLTPTSESDPSQGVRIVRDFLKKLFESPSAEPFTFEVLGPSPFHAKCYIQPGVSSKNASIIAERISSRGYDSVLFTYDPDAFFDEEELKDELFEEASDELALYYAKIDTNNIQQDNWHIILGQVNDLTKANNMPWWRRIPMMLLGHSRRLYAAHSSVTEFEMERLYTQYLMQRDYLSVYSDRKHPFFQTFIDRIFEDEFKYPAADVIRLIDFSESRRIQSVQILFLLFAALLGGVVGSLVTLLVK